MNCSVVPWASATGLSSAQPPRSSSRVAISQWAKTFRSICIPTRVRNMHSQDSSARLHRDTAASPPSSRLRSPWNKISRDAISPSMRWHEIHRAISSTRSAVEKILKSACCVTYHPPLRKTPSAFCASPDSSRDSRRSVSPLHRKHRRSSGAWSNRAKPMRWSPSASGANSRVHSMNRRRAQPSNCYARRARCE